MTSDVPEDIADIVSDGDVILVVSGLSTAQEKAQVFRQASSCNQLTLQQRGSQSIISLTRSSISSLQTALHVCRAKQAGR